jgi:hypothetical protein
LTDNLQVQIELALERMRVERVGIHARDIDLLLAALRRFQAGQEPTLNQLRKLPGILDRVALAPPRRVSF